mmetsp:Transcript_16888/g.21078  ORF Transcript_16888/g.21078 Transcript_16888/m.21078 type:complete len:280 (-) Transcript_16888:250-1089(-)|eukprot:CAMPEP_0172503692 /NCGR_PEP_ID=MMETSP1066-20121228/171382_1 /TAXON_ID=671091 /ORGANISM="Coscinodiscus wailesii, Strain CCMP2513" /LENGTH=279 /DNA_ID=CAMNT_0013279525 /DNA_START=117 /DNA_END=956 /DNA_ORIENTATION=+
MNPSEEFTLQKVLRDCGSTLGNDLDLDGIREQVQKEERERLSSLLSHKNGTITTANGTHAQRRQIEPLQYQQQLENKDGCALHNTPFSKCGDPNDNGKYGVVIPPPSPRQHNSVMMTTTTPSSLMPSSPRTNQYSECHDRSCSNSHIKMTTAQRRHDHKNEKMIQSLKKQLLSQWKAEAMDYYRAVGQLSTPASSTDVLPTGSVSAEPRDDVMARRMRQGQEIMESGNCFSSSPMDVEIVKHEVNMDGIYGRTAKSLSRNNEILTSILMRNTPPQCAYS